MLRSTQLLASIFVAAIVWLAPTSAAAQSFPVTVPATANLYGAGHATAPAPGGSGAGVLPTEVALPPGVGRTLTFEGVTGTLDFGPCCAPNDADGIASAGNAPANHWDGLAGMTIPRGRFLGAVFLDDNEPADPAPTPLVIPDVGFTSLAPGLRQTFFVGDGLTGNASGADQIFEVPDAATRLFLGVHDAGPPDTTLPGWYGDNSGGVTATVVLAAASAVPGVGALGALGLLIGLVGLVGSAGSTGSAGLRSTKANARKSS